MQRSIFRVEVAPWNGRYVLTDETKGNISALKVVNCSNAASNQHSHYTQLSFSYMGMWVYTASQMAAFMNSKYWSVTILDQDNTDSVREYAAWGFQRQELGGFQHSTWCHWIYIIQSSSWLQQWSTIPTIMPKVCPRQWLLRRSRFAYSDDADNLQQVIIEDQMVTAHPKGLDQCQLILIFKLMLILSFGKMSRHLTIAIF